MMMAMKAMKRGGEGGQYSGSQGAQGPGTKGGGKGKGKSDDRECHNCGGKGNIARNCPHPKNPGNSRVPAREVGHDEGEELVLGACVIDEVQDLDSAEDDKKKKNEIEAQTGAQRSNPRAPVDPKVMSETVIKDKPWRKKISGGHRLRFVLDSGAVKTIVPKDAIPGMKIGQVEGRILSSRQWRSNPELGLNQAQG